jgi:hypothetical protein
MEVDEKLDFDKTIVKCNSPQLIPNTRLPYIYNRHRTFNLGEAVHYACKSGYVQTENNQDTSSTCRMNTVTGNAEWSPANIACIPASCIPLPNPEHGKIIEKHNGSFATFECDRGYERSSPFVSNCNADGSWSITNFKCNPISCPELPDIYNGVLVGKKAQYLFEDKVKYTCNNNFSLDNGEAIRVCQADGTWSGKEPECVMLLQDEQDYGDNSNDDSSISEKGVVSDEDEDDDDDDDDHSADVNDNKKKCLKPTDVFENGSVDMLNQILLYSCDSDKFVLDGNTIRKCLNGVWEGTMPKCIQKKEEDDNLEEDVNLEEDNVHVGITYCPSLSPIENGQLEGLNIHYMKGHKVTYKCNSNFSLFGSSVRTCGSDGQWIDNKPVCIAKKKSKSSYKLYIFLAILAIAPILGILLYKYFM